jgi:hypothetical protein
MNLPVIIKDWLTDYRTYTGMLYSLLSLPLGVIYFTVLVTGFVMGGVLSFMLIGIPVLLMMLVASRVAARMDALTARLMVGADIPAFGESLQYPGDVWQQARSVFTDRRNWQSVLYLCLKFPVGIASFVVTIITLVMAILPFIALLQYDNPAASMQVLGMSVDTLPEALLTFPIGAALFLVGVGGVQLFNMVWRALAESLVQPSDADSQDVMHRSAKKKKRSGRLQDTPDAFDDDLIIDEGQRRLNEQR